MQNAKSQENVQPIVHVPRIKEYSYKARNPCYNK